jgi:hypothetical protein
MELRHNKYFIAFILLAIQFALFQNCAKVQMQSIDQPSVFASPEATQVTELSKNCDQARAEGRISVQKTQAVFDNNNVTCAWEKDNNLSKQNGIVRARTENYKIISIPSDATVCNVRLDHQDVPDFRYDDNIIMTLNDLILTSTTTFTQHFSQVGNLYKYEWSKLIGKNGQVDGSDSTPDKQYCAGKDTGLATCSFPKTETTGRIQLDFKEDLIQQVLGLTTPKALKLGVITTGDDNDTDCLHTPIQLSVDVEYFR